jgi:hypothetical protein
MDIAGGQVWEYYERFPERKMAVGDARDPFAANGLKLFDRFSVGYFDKDKRVWHCVSYQRRFSLTPDLIIEWCIRRG